jgi:hypothetical protein
MQFITDGPDIPDALLQAHEEGRVVFFCGAGISYPAGLPGFKGLVDSIYKIIGTAREEIEELAFEDNKYDATLDLLEKRLQGRRIAVRRALAEALKPNLRRKGAMDTHSALLRLGRNQEGKTRLVTTNFDNVFHKAARRDGVKFDTYSAPMLPVPKNSRWDGVVYLHGLLTSSQDEASLNRLVITSGDFGLAYLTERWAARFVSELFRNYVVCFVGYSINDPVLRYMMDALAADRMQGEITPQAWAFADYESGQEHKKTIEWEAKGVTPILYHIPVSAKGIPDHSALHKTLHAWADTYRDGALGKERIVVNHALSRPSASTQQDDYVGRMLWALSDKSGLPARQFADFDPVPSLDWLIEAFEKRSFQHRDLSRFGVTPRSEVDDKLTFSLVSRPAPYALTPNMGLFDSSNDAVKWDAVMFQIARWLIRHLNDPVLIISLAGNGGTPHRRLRMMIQKRLQEIDELQNADNISELDRIRESAPNAIPSPLMRKLWGLVLSRRVKSFITEPDLYQWVNLVKTGGMTGVMRLELRDMLAPCVLLKQPFRFTKILGDTDEQKQLRDLVDWELQLKIDHVKGTLESLPADLQKSVFKDMLDDLQQLLRDALDLLHELDEADEFQDLSHWHLPSIIPHWQNRGYEEWVVLIEYLRDGWLALYDSNHDRARQIAISWYHLPYPTFKRLAFFAASQNDCVSSSVWVEWLVEDNARWLWSVDTGREVFRLLVLQGMHLTSDDQEKLESAILAGPPPRNKSSEGLDQDQWHRIVQHEIWKYLSKLGSSGIQLGTQATEYLHNVSEASPEWKLADNQSDEFSHWMSGTGDPDFESFTKSDKAPDDLRELVQWLRDAPEVDRRNRNDDWRDVCELRFDDSVAALETLAEENVWPIGRWREALQVWGKESLTRSSWNAVAPLVSKMPDVEFSEVVHSVSWWTESCANSIGTHRNEFWSLCRRILELPLNESSRITRNGRPIDAPVTEAINHPVGHITEALVKDWLARKPRDNDSLPGELTAFLTEICQLNVARYRHGRVILAANLIALFRVDRMWVESYLLPIFSWQNCSEAKGVWEGFLWSPRLYKPLLDAFKENFLNTAEHYDALGEHRHQYVQLLTLAALEVKDGFTTAEFQSAIDHLPSEGLVSVVQALKQALDGAADQREAYWENRILPFWQGIWPKSRNRSSPRVSDLLAQLIITSETSFPKALQMVQDWLEPIDNLYYVLHLLEGSSLCTQFPQQAIEFLSIIINSQPFIPQELRTCLNDITKADPRISQSRAYMRLDELSRRNSL